MKTVKIAFIGFWKGYNPKDSLIYKLLCKDYNIQITNQPDYVICGCFEPYYSYLKYPQVRIMVCGENYIPDFNFIDYAIQRYPISFLDRSFYEPGCLRPYPDCMDIEKPKFFDKSILGEKTIFCSFISSHESEYGIRGDFFNRLCKYKKVSSVGTFLNNTGVYVNREDGSKLEFNKKCKFVLCFESTKNEGFLTEKINEAFLANAVPIYYGTSTCIKIYNPKSFINVSDFNSFDDAINFIKRIDNDDEIFLKMLNEQKFLVDKYLTHLINSETEFLRNIFDQPLEQCYRRSRIYMPKDYESFILQSKEKKENYLKKCIKTLLHKFHLFR